MTWNGLKGLEMDRNGWKWLDLAKMAEHFWKWLEGAGNG